MGNRCTPECKKIRNYGKHLLIHTDEALQLRGHQYTKQQVQDWLLGQLGGGNILPKYYTEIMNKVIKYYEDKNND